MGIIKGLVRSSERPPPDAETTGTMRHPKIGIQNNAIHAIVAAAQQLSIELAQSVHHRLLPRPLPNPGVYRIQICRLPQAGCPVALAGRGGTAPQGPLFHSRVWGKA
jgi:hypothetical protein